MAWLALGTAVVGAISSRNARKKANKNTSAAQAATDRQMALAERQAALAEQQYNDWRANYMPLGLEAIAEARRDVVPDYNRIAADNAAAYNAQRGDLTRSAMRMGMNPADGGFGTALGRLGTDEAKSHVLARNRAREDAKGQKLRNMTAVYGMGSGMPGLAASTFGSAMQGAGAAAGGYGAQAQNYQQQAAADAYGAGQAVGSIPWAQLWSSMQGSGNGGAATPVNSVGPTAGGYSYPTNNQPGPWAGGFGNYTSSREAKDNIMPVDPNDALDIVNQTPVATYNYTDDPQQQGYVGTIAEEAPGAISNGKQVNLVNQVGTLTGAVQALSKQMGSGMPATTVPYRMKNTAAPAAGGAMGARPAKPAPAPRRGMGTRIMDHFVPDRNGDGRRSGGEWGRAIADQALNYATGGAYGIGQRVVNAFRNRAGRTIPGVNMPVRDFVPIGTIRQRNTRRALGSQFREGLAGTEAAMQNANGGGSYATGQAHGDIFVNNMQRMAEQARRAMDRGYAA